MPSRSRSIRSLIAIAAASLVATLAAAAPASGKSGSQLGFGKPVFVDTALAGGEPFVIYSHKGHDLIYSSHEGTTHLFRDGVIKGPGGVGAFAANYRNQVNIWTSHDDGKTWQRVNYNGTGFFTNPAKNTGFSDPDLTEDEGGVIYDTGIDLANDTLFSTPDGGKTWPTGTVQCHEGDRPWLAGGHKNEVFLATNSDVPPGHLIFRSTNAGASCDQTGIADSNGDGKLYYDHTSGSIVEPTLSSDSTGDFVGVGVLPNASHAFATHSGSFTEHKVANTVGLLAPIGPAIALDSAGTIYEVWADQPRVKGTSGGCSQIVPGQPTPVGAETPAANSIHLAWSTNHGQTWSTPITVSHPGTTVLWPWVQAGNPGSVSVVWYQYDRVTDPDCGTGNASVYDANILNTTDSSHRTVEVANVVGRSIHSGGMCQSGTTCVVTGQDRRLGDYFSNAIDADGCVLVATGDTTMVDPITHGPLPTSRPLFIKQSSGMGLYGKRCVAAASAKPPTTVTPPKSSPGGSLATTGGSAIAAVIAAIFVTGAILLRRRARRAG
jgi:hypothetical protein